MTYWDEGSNEKPLLGEEQRFASIAKYYKVSHIPGYSGADVTCITL